MTKHLQVGSEVVACRQDGGVIHEGLVVSIKTAYCGTVEYGIAVLEKSHVFDYHEKFVRLKHEIKPVVDATAVAVADPDASGCSHLGDDCFVRKCPRYIASLEEANDRLAREVDRERKKLAVSQEEVATASDIIKRMGKCLEAQMRSKEMLRKKCIDANLLTVDELLSI